MSSLATNLLELLELARIKELGTELTKKGFSTTTQTTVGTIPVSLLAERPGLPVAYEVVSSDRLRDVAGEIAAKRTRLLSEGVTRFLISVVSLPKTTEVQIAGLPESLRDHLRSADSQVPLPLVGNATALLAVQNPEYDSITIDAYKTRVVGGAVAIISYNEPSPYENEEDDEQEREIPFNFDVSFTPDLKVKQIYFLEFDISGYEF